jgi:hypothetical protein
MLMERRRDAKQGADARFCLELAATAVALGILPHGPQAGPVMAPSNPQPKPSSPNSQPMQPVTEPRPSIKIAEKPASKPASPIAESSRPISNLSVDLTLGQIQSKWPTFIKSMDAKSPSLTFVLRISRPVNLENGTLFIQFQYPYHREKIIGDMKGRRLVEDCLNEVLACSGLRIDGMVGEESSEDKNARKEDMVNTILKAFGGSVVEESA